MRQVTPRVRAAPALLALLLAGCTSDQSPLTSAPATSAPATSSPPTSSPATAAPATSAPTTFAPGDAASQAASPRLVARAIYYLGADPRGPRLYREMHRRPATTAVVRDAVTAMLTEPPDDPDYRSLWARGTVVRGARIQGTTAFVDLSLQARTNGGGSAFEAATVQQLVHTVTAAAPGITAVRLLIQGRPAATLWGAVDTSGPLRRGPAAQVLGPVWLEVPTTLRRGAAFGGQASVFEATVSWEWRQGARVVRQGFSTATSAGPARGTWRAAVDVPPGTYELRAFESSAENGRPTWIDTKVVRVTR